MTILPGTPVKLPNGRDGVVIPSSRITPGRVLVKVKTGRRRWFRVDECVPSIQPVGT